MIRLIFFFYEGAEKQNRYKEDGLQRLKKGEKMTRIRKAYR